MDTFRFVSFWYLLGHTTHPLPVALSLSILHPPQGVNFLILDGIRLTGRDGWGGAGGIDPNRATYVRAFHFLPHRKVPGSTDLSRLALKVVFQTLNPCGYGVKVDPHATPYSYF